MLISLGVLPYLKKIDSLKNYVTRIQWIYDLILENSSKTCAKYIDEKWFQGLTFDK